MRIMVDFPAPLLPRNPKISPRATSKLTPSTATNWPNRRVRSRTSMVSLFPNGPLQPRVGEAHARDGARAIELRLEARDLRLEHVGAGRDTRLVPFPDDALGFGGGTDLVVRGGDGFPARRELEDARADLEGDLKVEILHASLERRRRRPRFSVFGRAASAVPEHPRQVDRRVPRRVPVAAARKDAGIRACVIVAATQRDLRTRGRGDGRGAQVGGCGALLERLPLRPGLERPGDEVSNR